VPTDDPREPGSDGQHASDDASRAAGNDALPETGPDAEQDLAMDDAGIGDPGTDTADTAAASALARAREAARAKGLRPGSRPTRKRRVPGQLRDDSAGSGRDPSLLGDQMDRLLLDRGWNLDVAVGAVMGRWSEIVGPNVAEHCKPVTFSDGVLTVRADSTAWTTQMRLMSSSILGRLETEVGKDAVTELRVQGPSAPSWSRGPRKSTGPGPRDTYG
jgi:predicted nucleic acid-binding Zn ribbon protein